MCGIVAGIGRPDQKMFDTVENLLAADIIRGRDSTGVFLLNKGRDGTEIVKDVLFPLELMRLPRYKRLITSNGATSPVIVGHNRAATKGKVTPRAAHPYRYNHITMVHNGTLDSDVDTKEPKAPVFQTDSESICYAIAQKGIKWTWENLYGAAALVWWDAIQGKLFCVTNGKRPLNVIYCNNRQWAFIASEKDILRTTAKRAGYDIEDNCLYFFKEHELFSYWWDEKAGMFDFESEVLKPAPFRSRVLPQGQRQARWWEDEEWEYNYGVGGAGRVFTPGELARRRQEKLKREEEEKRKEKEKEKGKAEVNKKGNQLILPPFRDNRKDRDAAFDKAFHKATMSEEEFKERYKACCSCDNVPDYDTAIVIDDKLVICENCIEVANTSGINLHANLNN